MAQLAPVGQHNRIGNLRFQPSSCDVAFWHLSDVAGLAGDVCFRGNSGSWISGPRRPLLTRSGHDASACWKTAASEISEGSPKFRRRFQWSDARKLGSDSDTLLFSGHFFSGKPYFAHWPASCDAGKCSKTEGGRNETYNRFIGAAGKWLGDHEHRAGQCRGVLPIH
jgi:hypothetical protein